MSMTIDQRRDAYAAEYRKRWAEAKIDPDRRAEVFAIARKIIAVRDRYSDAARATRVPWWFIAIAHYRESGLRFDRHLHEGSPLTARTKFVPIGRPLAPPADGKTYTFTESAIDALTMPGKNFDRIKVWDIVEVSLRLEQYNGFGYRGKGIPSPYLYAATNQSTELGKYVRDGVFDRSAPDRQVGCIAIMLALQELGISLFGEIAPAPLPDVPPIEPKPAPKPVAATIAEKPKTAGAAGAAIFIGLGSAAAATGASPHNVTGFLALGGIALVVVAVCVGLLIKRHKGA